MPASLLTLPFELLHHIVLLAIPPEEAVSQYRNRQRMLISLCKTSRMLCQVAQPVLWRVLVLASDAVPLLQRHAHKAAAVRVVRIEAGQLSIQSILEHLDRFPTLREVRITDRDLSLRKQDWAAFASAGIAHPTLVDVKFARTSFDSLVFPHLRTLTLRAIPPRRGDFLPPSSCPALGAVYTTTASLSSTSSKALEFEGYSQLDMLQVRLNTDLTFLASLHSRRYPVLLTFSLDDVSPFTSGIFASFRHFHLDAAIAGTPAELTILRYRYYFDRLIELVQTLPDILSFSLPVELHPDTPIEEVRRTRLEPDGNERRQRLLDALDSRDAKVIWRLNSREAADDVEVDREFWQYAKELKARKALEANEADEAATSGSA